MTDVKLLKFPDVNTNEVYLNKLERNAYQSTDNAREIFSEMLFMLIFYYQESETELDECIYKKAVELCALIEASLVDESTEI